LKSRDTSFTTVILNDYGNRQGISAIAIHKTHYAQSPSASLTTL